MKKLMSLLLVLLLALPVSLFCSAEELDQKILENDRNDLRFCIAMMADMVGNALDQIEETEDVAVRNLLSTFAQIDYLSPDKAIVVNLSKDQMSKAIKALKINKWEYAAHALGSIFNKQASNDYLQAAKLSQLEHIKVYGVASSTFILIILPYGDNIAVLSAVTPNKTDLNVTGSFVMATADSSQSLEKAGIDQLAQQFGVENAAIRVYEKQDLDQLLSDEEWHFSSPLLTDAVCSSAKRLQALAPELLRSDSPYLNNPTIKQSVLRSVLENMEFPDQEFLREISSDVLPSLAKLEEDPLGAFLEKCDYAYAGKISVPRIDYDNVLHETELKPDGTYLVLFTREIPEQETEEWYDVILEAALPADHIPKSIDEADYIILCETVYEGGIKDKGAYVHYPLTSILIYDAHTGELLKHLGSVKRMAINGVAYVTHKGDTWWDPLRTMIWEKIKTLFEEK